MIKPTMPWQELTFDVSPSEVETLSEILCEAGAAAVTFKDNADTPIYEPAADASDLWASTCVVGLFDAEADFDAVLARVQQTALFPALPPYRITELKEQQWERLWMDEFKPMRFGEHLWICPTETTPSEPGALNIMLDPGLAFGTGTHPTTALCLEWIDQNDLDDKTMIDFGCGSGILAIGAAMSGATSIEAIDIDPQALLATNSNATQNNIASKITTTLPNECNKLPAVDCLLANILANPIMELADYFSTLVKHNGIIVLSGILSEQATEVISHYEKWFEFQPIVEKEGWVRLVATRNEQ
ncbi:MAG: 50S ribosomal protein L11 methyltransferase [Gammaproteobacteria bacterium]|nr:50S ribosomal protein L11 methyltransferase [Gammaproteobacteria bacterium]